MTIPATKKPNWVIALGIPFLIYAICFLITFSSKFKTEPGLLSGGILIDVLVTAPLMYFLAIRKSSVPKLTVLRVFVVGLLVAGFILNNQSNAILKIIKTWISPVIEGFILIFISRKFYVANKKTKENNRKTDFLIHCRSVMCEVTGSEKTGNIISSEFAVMYYAFFSKKDKTIDYKTTFSSYKENGLPLILGVILCLFPIETTGIHFLLSMWSKPVAWILTTLSIYTGIQLFAHLRAIKARPIIINSRSLEVHNGLAGDAYIGFDNIEKIELSKKIPTGRNSVKIALLNGLENHNIVVYLKKPIQVTRIFGIKKSTDTVLFFVDRPKDFLNSVNALLTNSRY